MGWERYADRATIGMTTFGASAPLKELQKKFGFTPERGGGRGQSSKQLENPLTILRWRRDENSLDHSKLPSKSAEGT